MADINKVAMGFTMAIVAIAIGFALVGEGTQNVPIVSPPVVSAPTTSPPPEEPAMVEEESPAKPSMAGWDRLESALDPGVGHEQHQLAIILPPSDDVYSGKLMYDASENIQLVALHGPLAEGEDKGQAIWTPDGETKFALTFVDPMNAKGNWQFAGNALAVHTMNPTQFIVDYKVDYEKMPMSETVMTGTTRCPDTTLRPSR